MSYEMAAPPSEVENAGGCSGSAEADADFVEKMSAKWVELEVGDLIRVVRRLCWETNKYLFKVAPDAPVRVFPVLSKVPEGEEVEKFGGLEHSPFFWFGRPEGESWRDNNGFVTLPDLLPPMRAEAGENPSMGPNGSHYFPLHSLNLEIFFYHLIKVIFYLSFEPSMRF
jgi:hypothetical protein